MAKTLDKLTRIKEKAAKEGTKGSGSPSAKLAAKVRRQGFDRSFSSNGKVSVRCSQCEALVINGIPTHEHNCPNKRRDQ